jgi:NADH-quinone oxidoreductase subunit H
MNKRTLGIIATIVVILLVGGLLATIYAGYWLYTNWEPVMNWIGSYNDPAKIINCYDNATCAVAWPIIWTLIIALTVITGFAYTTLLERKILAFLQKRVGPNRVGPGGFMQPAADAVKLIFKEVIVPDGVDKPVFFLAPILKTVPVLFIFAVIPFGPALRFPWFDGNWYNLPLTLADVNVAVLFILGITSIGTYGIVLAGWSSNNKYAMLGGLRASAQMISYELCMGLTMAVPVMIASSMSLLDIVNAQKYPWEWFVFQNPLAAGILLIALFAETSRAPFDLVEAEQELTAGFMTEYSAMQFAMFMMAEYMGMIAVSAVIISLYFGGFHFLPVDNMPILGPLVFGIKVFLFLCFFIWVRGTLPRIRYDRLMAFGWKVLLPLSLVAVAWSSIAVVLREANFTAYVFSSIAFFLIIVIGGLFFLSRDGDKEETEQEENIYDDPMITGRKTGAGWIALNLVGGLIAVPFAIVNGIINGLEKFGEATAGNSDETAIVPSDKGGD